MKVFAPRKCRTAVVAGALGALSACGMGTSPTPPGRTILIAGATFVVRAATAGFTRIERPPAGRIDVTARWNGRNPIDVYVTDAACSGFPDVAAGRCSIVALDESGMRPKVVAFDSEPGTSYGVWMANRGAFAETVTLDAVVFTSNP